MPRPRTYGTLYHLLAARPVGPCRLYGRKTGLCKIDPYFRNSARILQGYGVGHPESLRQWLGRLTAVQPNILRGSSPVGILVDKAAAVPPSVLQSFTRSFAPAAFLDLDSAKRPAPRGSVSRHEKRPSRCETRWPKRVAEPESRRQHVKLFGAFSIFRLLPVRPPRAFT